MAAGANATLLANLIDPQVLADFVDKKLVDAIRFAPLATVDNTLVGRPGDTITLPSYSYIGDAESVEEGGDIPIAKLTASETTVKVAKIGKAVEISDEAILAGAGDVVNEAGTQILTAINSGVEANLLSNMASNTTLSKNVAASDDAADAIADALTLFGEDLDGEKVLVIPPAFYAKLRKSESWVPNTEIGAQMLVRGVVGMVHGCQVITSNRLNPAIGSTNSLAYIIKPGALRIYHKRGTMVEFDRDILSQMNYIAGSNIFAPYVYDKSKIIKLVIANPYDSLSVEPEAGETVVFGHTVSDMQTGVSIANGAVTGTLHKVTSGQLVTDWGEGYFLTLKWASSAPSGVTSEKVGLQPSAGSGLVEAINDTDHNGVFKITNKDVQDFVVQLDGNKGIQYQRYDLSGLTLD